MPGLFFCGPWPSCYPRPRFVSRGFSGGRVRRSATWGYSADNVGLEVHGHCAGNVLAARSLVVNHLVKQFDAAELRIAVAALLAAAVDAVLVAYYLPILGAHLVTALARMHVHNLARRSSLEAESTREKKSWEKRTDVKSSV